MGQLLVLADDDLRAAALPEEIVAAMEEAFRIYSAGKYQMPQRLHLELGENVLLLMPSAAAGSLGTKLVTLFPGNADRGLPLLHGLMVLTDGQTGIPLALLNGPVLTALRTGAVGALSLRYLCDSQMQRLGIVGAGTQGFYQACMAAVVRPLTDLFIYDSQPAKITEFIQKLNLLRPDIRCHAAAFVEDVLVNSQAVITATTSRIPVLPERPDLLRGKHYVAIGSYQPGARELPESLFSLLDAVFVDTEHALEETGDLIVPLHQGWLRREQVRSFGHFISGEKKSPAKMTTTLFKCVGMALFDLFAARLLYQKSCEKGLGQRISL